MFPRNNDEMKYGEGGVEVAIPGVGSLGDDYLGVANVR